MTLFNANFKLPADLTIYSDPFKASNGEVSGHRGFFNVEEERCKPPIKRDLDPLIVMCGRYDEEGKRREVRRPKFIPEEKSDEQLLESAKNIEPGSCFDEKFGHDKDAEVRVTGGVGEIPSIVNTFEECFSSSILLNLNRKKFRKPTQVQKAVIPLISSTKFDILVHAQTGTGKTAAFLLPIIQNIQGIKLNNSICINSNSPLALILAPTRELVYQLYEEARIFATGTSVDVTFAHGDVPMSNSIRLLRSGCDILVATIGRLAHYTAENIIKIDNVRYFVIDEADKFLGLSDSLEFIREIRNRLFSKLSCSEIHRTFMFSATYSAEVKQIVQEFLLPNHFFVTVGGLNRACVQIAQAIISVADYEKLTKLKEILTRCAEVKLDLELGEYLETEKTIVFVNGRRQCDRLAIALIYYFFHKTISLHSARTQEQRNDACQKFADGRYNILVATDCAARGLNFANVAHVINYDMPRNGQFVQYIHRIGRTGRVGHYGRATTFFDSTNVHEDMSHVINLVMTLRSSNQNVPEWLETLYNDRVEMLERLNCNFSTSQQPVSPTNVHQESITNLRQNGVYQNGLMGVKMDSHMDDGEHIRFE